MMDFSITNDWSKAQAIKVFPELEITFVTPLGEATRIRVIRIGWLTHSFWLERLGV